jgi:hypothetical protein
MLDTFATAATSHIYFVMSQADIDVFVRSAGHGKLTTEGVITAVVSRGIPVNAQNSSDSNFTAFHYTVYEYEGRREVAVALLAVGANPNVKDTHGRTSLWWGAYHSSANILQLLIDGGGSVNEADNFGMTPLIALVMYRSAKVQVLFACPELDLDAVYNGMTAKQWAAYGYHFELVEEIAHEQKKTQAMECASCCLDCRHYCTDCDPFSILMQMTATHQLWPCLRFFIDERFCKMAIHIPPVTPLSTYNPS